MNIEVNWEMLDFGDNEMHKKHECNKDIYELKISPFDHEGENYYIFKKDDIFGNRLLSDKLLKIERITHEYIIISEFKGHHVYRMTLDEFVQSLKINGCTIMTTCKGE